MESDETLDNKTKLMIRCLKWESYDGKICLDADNEALI